MAGVAPEEAAEICIESPEGGFVVRRERTGRLSGECNNLRERLIRIAIRERSSEEGIAATCEFRTVATEEHEGAIEAPTLFATEPVAEIESTATVPQVADGLIAEQNASGWAAEEAVVGGIARRQEWWNSIRFGPPH